MRTTTWLASAAATVLVTVASPTTAVAAPAAAGPVGTWSGTVRFDGGQLPIELAFHPGGRLCIVPASPGPDGGAEGTGSWASLGSGVAFRVTERLFDANGATTGFIEADNAGRQRADRIDAAGRSGLQDADGQPFGTTTTATTLRRSSPVPASC